MTATLPQKSKEHKGSISMVLQVQKLSEILAIHTKHKELLAEIAKCRQQHAALTEQMDQIRQRDADLKAREARLQEGERPLLRLALANGDLSTMEGMVQKAKIVCFSVGMLFVCGMFTAFFDDLVYRSGRF